MTSNRDSSEWLAAIADPLLAQSAIDRLQSSAWELIVEGESYRRRQKPTLTQGLTSDPSATKGDTSMTTILLPMMLTSRPVTRTKWSLARGNRVVPSAGRTKSPT